MRKHLRIATAAFAALSLGLVGCEADDGATDPATEEPAEEDTGLEEEAPEEDTGLEEEAPEEDAG